MRYDPLLTRIRRMRIVLEERERRAHSALQRSVAAYVEATAELTQINHALALQAAARGARERQIYEQMVGRPLFAREITELDAQLRRLERLARALAEQRLASIRTVDQARNEVQGLRLQFVKAHRRRRKWDELSQQSRRRREGRETLLEELANSDGRAAGQRA
jgi:phage-related tail protein